MSSRTRIITEKRKLKQAQRMAHVELEIAAQNGSEQAKRLLAQCMCNECRDKR